MFMPTMDHVVARFVVKYSTVMSGDGQQTILEYLPVVSAQRLLRGETLVNDKDVIENRDDVEMIRRQHLWPNSLMLPLKRYEGSEIVIAIIRDVDVKPGEVRVNKNASLFGVIGTLEVLSYESPEAVVEDGWRVD